MLPSKFSDMESNPILTTQARIINSISSELIEEQGLDQMLRLFGDVNAQPFPDECCEEFMALGGVLGEEVLCTSALEQALGFYSVSNSNVDPCIIAPSAGGDVEEALEEKDEDGESSGTTEMGTRPGRDRARTLVSERKRRGRMKEKLYELRALVPNITKMDKASIIGDAIVYIKDLQKHANTLTEEITKLESTSTAQTFRLPLQDQRPLRTDDMGSSIGKREILQITAFEVGDQRFFLRMECNSGGGAPAALYRAMEALTFVHLESSSFSLTPSERHEVNIVLKVRGCTGEMDASTLRLWVMTALMNEGFEFKMVITSS